MFVPALPLKRHIAILGFLIVAPLIIVQGVILYQIAGSERVRLEEDTTATADNIAKIIDRVLQASEYTLLALSTSNFLDTADLTNFHAQASQVAAKIPGAIIGLRDSSGRILIATSRPPGHVFGIIDPILKQADEDTLASQKTTIVNLYHGATSGEKFINVQLPITRSGKQYILSLAFTSRYIAELMSQASLDQTWVATIIDGNNRVIARTRDNERFAGQAASADFLSKIDGDRGRFAGKTLEGVDVANGYVRSPYSGWVIIAGTPISVLEAPLKRSLWQLIATAIVGWALATLLALIYSRTFTTPLSQLQDMAAAGAHEYPVKPLETSVRELNILSDALSMAFAQIRRHAVDQSLLANELGHRVKNTLTTVQAISALSIRHAASIDDFHTAFSSRIIALARSHDLLLAREWKSSTIFEVIENSGVPFCDAGRRHVSGDNRHLESQQAISLGMILHELFTNATKYGALSTPHGHIEIVSRMTDAGTGVELEWREHGGPPVVEASRKGFGTTLMAAMVRQLNGTISTEWRNDGLFVVLKLNLGEHEKQNSK